MIKEDSTHKVLTLVVFFILPIKILGLGTHCGILIMQAKFHVLRLTHNQFPCCLLPLSHQQPWEIWSPGLLESVTGCQRSTALTWALRLIRAAGNHPPGPGDTNLDGSYYLSVTAELNTLGKIKHKAVLDYFSLIYFDWTILIGHFKVSHSSWKF